MASKEYELLIERAKVIRRYGRELAASLGNFHGINDYLHMGVTLYNAEVLEQIARDLTALVILRAQGLIGKSTTKFETDATLMDVARALKSRDLRREVFEAACHPQPNDHPFVTRMRPRWVGRRMYRFRRDVKLLDPKLLREHRDWRIAHPTITKAGDLSHGPIWESAGKVLAVADAACFLTFGRDAHLVSHAKNQREQSLLFLTHNIHPEPD